MSGQASAPGPSPQVESAPLLRPNLIGRTALITGAAGGIGRAVALRIAQEGARVFLTDLHDAALRGTVSLLEENALAACGRAADVADPKQVREVVQAAQEELGDIDILVNCAGIVHDEPVQEMSLEAWDRVIRTNLTSVFLMCRAVVPGMCGRGYGRVINFTSQLAAKGAAGHSAYAASKAGVVAFTKALAHEVSPVGVTANCVGPGPIDTPMLNKDGNAWTDERVKQLPMRRIGDPREVAGTVVLLASEVDGALYTGQTLGPNSGDYMP